MRAVTNEPFDMDTSSISSTTSSAVSFFLAPSGEAGPSPSGGGSVAVAVLPFVPAPAPASRWSWAGRALRAGQALVSYALWGPPPATEEDARGSASDRDGSDGVGGSSSEASLAGTPRMLEPVMRVAVPIHSLAGRAPVPEDSSPSEGSSDDSQTRFVQTVAGAILQYLLDPSDYYLSVLSTALLCRDANHLIGAGELSMARCNRVVVACIARSGLLDVSDPGVQWLLAQCVSEALSEAPVPGTAAEYLRVLFEMPCVRITRAQRRLLLTSGFEFVALLEEHPHVTASIARLWSSRSRIADTVRLIQPLINVLALVLIAFETAALGYVEYYWFGRDSQLAFNVTIITYLGSHVIECFAIFATLRLKTSQPSVYGDAAGDFPSFYLKTVPFLPLMELFICTSDFSHRLCRRRHTVNLALTHDVRALMSACHISHATAHSVVQLLLQSYFFLWTQSTADARFTGFRMLVAATLTNLFVALTTHVAITSTFDSVTNIGFARFSSDTTQPQRRVLGFFSRTIALILLYLFLTNSFFLTIAIVNISECSTQMIIWISVAGVVLLSTVVVFSLSAYYSGNIIRAARWCVPPMLTQAAFTIYVNAIDPSDAKEECRLFFIIGGVNIVVGYVGWGLLLATVVAWGIHRAYLSYHTKWNPHHNHRGPLTPGGGGV